MVSKNKNPTLRMWGIKTRISISAIIAILIILLIIMIIKSIPVSVCDTNSLTNHVLFDSAGVPPLRGSPE